MKNEPQGFFAISDHLQAGSFVIAALEGVYMIPARFSFRCEFTPVTVDSHSSTKTDSDVM